MKTRITLLSIALILLFSILFVGCADASVSDAEGELEYMKIGEDICYITGVGTWEGTDLKIPTEIDGYTVVGIFGAIGLSPEVKSVTIPATIEIIQCRLNIGSVVMGGTMNPSENLNPFAYCSGLTTIVVEEGNPKYHSEGNCLIETDTKILMAGCANSTIPTDGSVTSIGSYAFSGCRDLAEITIPDSVTSIGYGAFSGCSGLTSVNIPESVTSIGDSGYAYRYGQSYGCNAFLGCYGLTDMSVDDENPVYHSSGNCIIETATKVLISGCSSSVIPTDGSVTSIGGDAFRGCKNLARITIPDTVTSIGSYAFSECSKLTTIIIPEGVTSIGTAAFFYCADLTNVSIPDSITNVDVYAFAYCDNLLYSEYANGRYLGNADNPLVLLVSVIDTSAESFALASTARVIYLQAFDNCENIKEIRAADLEAWLNVHVGLSLNDMSADLYLNGEKPTKIVIPDTITKINDNAFRGCQSLTSVTIPNSVTSIGDSAFEYCSNLTEINIPNSVTSIGSYAFSGCDLLTEITIPDSVTSIGSYAFSGCDLLTEITIPDSVTSIGGNAVPHCGNLMRIVVEKGNAVYHSSGNCLIETATGTLISGCVRSVIPDDGSVMSIGSDAFWGCDFLTEITIPDSVTSIGSYAFSDCWDLAEITIPDSVTSIGYGAFSYCSTLTRINYNGTKAQWDEIEKKNGWDVIGGENSGSRDYTIYCTDGNIE